MAALHSSRRGSSQTNASVIGASFVNVQQAIGQRVAIVLNLSVAREPVQIRLHSEHAECPCTRTRKRHCRRNRGLEESSCRAAQSGILRLTQNRSQSPECAAMAVF